MARNGMASKRRGILQISMAPMEIKGPEEPPQVGPVATRFGLRHNRDGHVVEGRSVLSTRAV